MIANSVLDVMVSSYASAKVTKKSRDINLLAFLTTPSEEAIRLIHKLRHIEDIDERRNFKGKNLPAITPSGTFSDPRNQSNLIQHSGLIQMDVDYKDNPHVDMKELKKEFTRLKQAAYIGFSSSGKGLWGLFPIKHSDKHKQHFKWFADWIEAYFNIEVDRAPSNPASLRFYSFDEEAYFNHNAESISRLSTPKPPKYSKSVDPDRLLQNIEACVEQIKLRGVDITGDYKQWVELGFALANTLGEAGREIYHAISVYSPTYGRGRTPDEQYTLCLHSKSQGSTIGIATFFKICKQHDILFSLKNFD
jgi:hypothetical protein